MPDLFYMDSPGSYIYNYKAIIFTITKLELIAIVSIIEF